MPDPTLDVDLGLDLSTFGLVAAAGVTYRKIDYWTRCGWLHAIGQNTPGSGSPRRYAESEVAVARALDILVPLAAGTAGGHGRRFDIGEVARWIRMGLRGVVPVLPGVLLDLDVLCGE